MMARSLVSRASLPLKDFPLSAQAFAELPYAAFTEQSRQYHLRTYERWCRERDEEPWPATLERLLRYAAQRAETKAYMTVRAHVRIVSVEQRKHGGHDLFAHPTMQTLLEGIKRERPPAPVRPLRPGEIDTLLNFRPKTTAQHRDRVIVLLAYAAGFGIDDHVALQCEMVRFSEHGAIISGLSEDRPHIVIGRAANPDRCPVEALRALIGDRTSGPVYRSSRSRSADKPLQYGVIAYQVAHFGRTAGVTPLSNTRIRLSGLLEQARQIDIVRLAHFHGYRSIETLAVLLGRYVGTSGQVKSRWRRRECPTPNSGGPTPQSPSRGEAPLRHLNL